VASSEATRLAGALLIAGNLVFDILAGPIGELVLDGTVWPEHVAEGLGGNGAVTAFAAAMQGVQTQLLTAVGDDTYGRLCRARLSQAGVNAHFLEPCHGATPLTIGLFRHGGARALVHRPGVMRHAFEHVDSLVPFAQAHTTHFHLANPFGVPALRRRAPAYLAEARSLGWSTSLDTGWDKAGEWMSVIGPCLPHLDFLFTNEPESAALTGLPDPARAASVLQQDGPAHVVVKCGPRGCLHLAPGAPHTLYPAFSVEALDSTGAGDCFCGGFLAALVAGHPLPAAFQIANACGALSVSAPGATTGLLDAAATHAWLAGRPDASANP
jgi:sugar/nucleoside kinase (ribokinase family)